MELFRYIKNKTLLIVPSIQKQKILEEMDTYDNLFDIKILSLEEFRKKYYFDYTQETLLYIVKKYDLKIDVAKVYLENMYHLSGLYTSSDKLNELTLMKNNLLDHNLLKRDTFFTSSLDKYSIIFYGYDFYLKEDLKMIEELKKITDVQIFQNIENPKRKLQVYEFLTIEEEIEFVFKNIILLLEKQVPYSRIKLAQVSKEYREPLLRLAKFYKLPISISNSTSIFETLIGKKAISYIKEGYDFYDIINFLEKDFPYEEVVISQILSIFNQYAFFKEDKTKLLEFLIDDMKNTHLPNVKYQDEIEMIQLLHNEIDSSYHVFILGFNNGIYPSISKDEDFMSDALKEECGMTTSQELNLITKKTLMNRLFALSNVVITYKKKTAFEEYYPSTLISDYDMEVITYKEEFERVHYSKIQDTLKLTSMLDKYVKFGTKDSLLEEYYTTLKIPYAKYNHQYQPINKKDLHGFLKEKLLLSYSSLDNFYHCKFRYYLANILKIEKYEASLQQNIGTVFHNILSRCFEESFDFDREYRLETEKYIQSAKDNFYFQKLKKELQVIITILKKQNCILGFQKSNYEKSIYIPLEQEIPTTFMGIVDKILQFESAEKKYCAIIDYKTGYPSLDLSMVPYGMSMQLPIYMYLIKNSKEFKDNQICGIYLQKILNSIPANIEDVLTYKNDALKLQGYSIDSEDCLEVWDPTYENSEVIRSLKKGKNGWYRYAKLLSLEQMDKLIQITEEKVKQAAKNILEANFTIDPKRIDNQNIGCLHCHFHDICYHKEQDIVDLTAYSDLSFLNSDN